jgi:archaellum component FlaG (FlaF/FlaG flagellin family)
LLLLLLALAPISICSANINTIISYGQTYGEGGTEVVVINPSTGDGNFTYSPANGTLGTRFNATFWVYNVTGLFGFQVNLIINDTFLNITRAWTPVTDTSYVFYGQAQMPLGPTFYDIDGNGVNERVLVGATELFGATAFTGDGLLAIIELEIIYTPPAGTISSPLNINNTDTKLLDDTLSEIITIKTDGNYQYMGPTGPTPAHIYIDPEQIIDPTLVPSSSFQVNVSILNANNVYGFMFKLKFDPSTLNVETAVLGSFFPSITPQVTINNTAGYVQFSAELSPSEPPKSGNGILAIITFHVKNIGITDLELYTTELWDENGIFLPHTTANGFFRNISFAQLYVEPQEIISPDLMPGFIFTVDIMLDDIENMYGFEFNLGYNTKMLTCIGMRIHPLFNETHFTTYLQMDDSTGYIWVKVDYYPPANPITTYTPAALVTLTFMVDNIGLSILDLYDTNVTDPNDQPIPHEAIDGYVQTLIRDVAVTNLTSSHTWAYAGWTVNITVTVKNLGNVSETFDVTAFYGNNTIGTITVANLLPNEERTLTFVWNTTNVEEGTYVLSAEASYVPYEFNLTNNYCEDDTIEIRRLIRDVAILNVYPNMNATYPGWTVNITVIVKNEGNISETFDVTVYYDNNTVDTQTVVDLPPGEEAILTFLWNTTGLEPCNNYTIRAEASQVPYEIDLTNNYFTDGYVKIKIWGDINNDGKVDITDMATLAIAFGSYPGHPRWNPDADLTLDQKIDILDLALAASHYGETC